MELKGDLKEFIAVRTYLINLIIMTVIWIVSSFDYYMISFEMKYFQGNMFMNSILSSFSEAVAYLLSGILFSKIGLKPSLLVSWIIAIVGGVSLIFF